MLFNVLKKSFLNHLCICVFLYLHPFFLIKNILYKLFNDYLNQMTQFNGLLNQFFNDENILCFKSYIMFNIRITNILNITSCITHYVIYAVYIKLHDLNKPALLEKYIL